MVLAVFAPAREQREGAAISRLNGAFPKITSARDRKLWRTPASRHQQPAEAGDPRINHKRAQSMSDQNPVAGDLRNAERPRQIGNRPAERIAMQLMQQAQWQCA